MSEETDLEEKSLPKRDWPEFREWANLVIALAALLLGVVTLWTTAQISGLEDYLRSELARRNVELDEAALAARQLDERVLRSEVRLEDLRLTADRLSVSSSEAQMRLAEAQARSLELLADQQRSGVALTATREELARVATEVEEREAVLAEYRRQEVLERAYQTFRYIGYAGLFENDPDRMANEVSGPYGLDEMRNFGIAETDPETAGYYESVRTVGSTLCRSLDNFSPSFPRLRDNPSLGPRPGRRTERGVVMTRREADEWEERVREWSAEWDRVSAHNRAVREARGAASSYIRDSLRHCACVSISMSRSTCPEAPQRPDLDEIYTTIAESEES